MAPPLACFPVCMTFAALAILAVVILVFGVGNPIPGDDLPAAPVAPRDPNQKMGPPPWWVFPLMLLAVALFMLALGLYWPD